MKKVIVLIAIAVGAVIVYRWANPPPDPYEGLPDWLRKDMERSEKEFREDMAGDLGKGAIALCRARLGIKEPVENARDIIYHGYGSERATAFMDCVANLMYPVPDKK